jgi:hypothetical protein
MIDVVRLRRDRMLQGPNGAWVVMLRRQKNGNPVYVAIPTSAAEAVLALPPMSDQYFFWTGRESPEQQYAAGGEALSMCTRWRI